MDYSISLTVTEDILKPPEAKRVGDYWVRGLTIYYELPYPFKCKFAVSNLDHIFVTPGMLKLPTFLKYHNIDWLRQQLQQVKCVEQGALLLHGAAWKKDGVGYLAVGFMNSGKTTRVLREMCPPGGFTIPRAEAFCSDENVILDSNGILLPVARPSSVNRGQIRYFGLPLGLRAKIGLLGAEIRSRLFPIFEPNIWIDLPYRREAFKLDKLIYLSPGNGKSLRLLTDNEFPFYTNPVLQTYAYATGWDNGNGSKYWQINYKRR